jgi:hypothetical protein
MQTVTPAVVIVQLVLAAPTVKNVMLLQAGQQHSPLLLVVKNKILQLLVIVLLYIQQPARRDVFQVQHRAEIGIVEAAA